MNKDFRKTYNAINYHFRRKANPILKKVEVRVRQSISGMGLTPSQVRNIIKKNIDAERKLLRANLKTPNQITTYARQFELISEYNKKGMSVKLEKVYKTFSISEKVKTYKNNICTAIDQLDIRSDIKDKVKKIVQGMTKQQLKYYQDILDELLEMYTSDELYNDEINSIIMELLDLSIKNKK